MDTERAIDSAETLLRQWAVQIEPIASWRLDVLLPTGDLTQAAQVLCGTEWGTLTGITVLEPGTDNYAFELIYDFRHGQALVCIRVRLTDETDSVPSLTHICPCAEPLEQSFTDRYGIRFV
jgi:Ni,Fe-hydrogenase III component G